MKRVLILGGNGMAGHLITKHLEETKKYKVKNICHKIIFNRNSIICDVLELDRFKNILQDIKPDIIINAIGILNDKSDDNIVHTFYINTILPKWLENHYRNSSCKIIQLSTDCVFDGKKGLYKDIDDKTDESIYGLSKNFGEIVNDKDLTIRMSIIGPELTDGKGLFDWFMRQKDGVKGYANVYWSGITTLELAKIIDKAINENISGLYNVAPDNKISKYDLLQLIKKVFKKSNIEILKDESKHSDKSLIPTKKGFNCNVKSYEDMLIDLKTWMDDHLILYQKYYSNTKEKKTAKIKTHEFTNKEDKDEILQKSDLRVMKNE